MAEKDQPTDSFRGSKRLASPTSQVGSVKKQQISRTSSSDMTLPIDQGHEDEDETDLDGESDEDIADRTLDATDFGRSSWDAHSDSLAQEQHYDLPFRLSATPSRHQSMALSNLEESSRQEDTPVPSLAQESHWQGRSQALSIAPPVQSPQSHAPTRFKTIDYAIDPVPSEPDRRVIRELEDSQSRQTHGGSRWEDQSRRSEVPTNRVRGTGRALRGERQPSGSPLQRYLQHSSLNRQLSNPPRTPLYEAARTPLYEAARTPLHEADRTPRNFPSPNRQLSNPPRTPFPDVPRTPRFYESDLEDLNEENGFGVSGGSQPMIKGFRELSVSDQGTPAVSEGLSRTPRYRPSDFEVRMSEYQVRLSKAETPQQILQLQDIILSEIIDGQPYANAISRGRSLVSSNPRGNLRRSGGVFGDDLPGTAAKTLPKGGMFGEESGSKSPAHKQHTKMTVKTPPRQTSGKGFNDITDLCSPPSAERPVSTKDRIMPATETPTSVRTRRKKAPGTPATTSSVKRAAIPKEPAVDSASMRQQRAAEIIVRKELEGHGVALPDQAVDTQKVAEARAASMREREEKAAALLRKQEAAKVAKEGKQKQQQYEATKRKLEREQEEARKKINRSEARLGASIAEEYERQLLRNYAEDQIQASRRQAMDDSRRKEAAKTRGMRANAEELAKIKAKQEAAKIQAASLSAAKLSPASKLVADSNDDVLEEDQGLFMRGPLNAAPSVGRWRNRKRSNSGFMTAAGSASRISAPPAPVFATEADQANLAGEQAKVAKRRAGQSELSPEALVAKRRRLKPGQEPPALMLSIERDQTPQVYHPSLKPEPNATPEPRFSSTAKSNSRLNSVSSCPPGGDQSEGSPFEDFATHSGGAQSEYSPFGNLARQPFFKSSDGFSSNGKIQNPPKDLQQKMKQGHSQETLAKIRATYTGKARVSIMSTLQKNATEKGTTLTSEQLAERTEAALEIRLEKLKKRDARKARNSALKTEREQLDARHVSNSVNDEVLSAEETVRSVLYHETKLAAEALTTRDPRVQIALPLNRSTGTMNPPYNGYSSTESEEDPDSEPETTEVDALRGEEELVQDGGEDGSPRPSPTISARQSADTQSQVYSPSREVNTPALTATHNQQATSLQAMMAPSFWAIFVTKSISKTNEATGEVEVQKSSPELLALFNSLEDANDTACRKLIDMIKPTRPIIDQVLQNFKLTGKIREASRLANENCMPFCESALDIKMEVKNHTFK